MIFKRILLAALVFAAALTQARAEERIESFISDVDVQRNGDLIVTESIQVWAEGRQIRRGILRDFPTTYRRADGSRVEVGFDVLSVARNGNPEHYVTERMINGVRIRIGRSDDTINTASHLYVIKYRTTRQIGFFEKYDELYWNATGTGWTFPIDVAEARIRLPEDVPIMQSAIYTGPQGARGVTPRSSSRSRASSFFAQRNPCRLRTASPSPRVGRKAWCSRPPRCRSSRRC
jgi:hypothetical protein